MQTDYPEIKALNDIFVKHKVWIKITRDDILDGDEHYPTLDFQLAGKAYTLYIDDEYGDLKYNYPLLNLCLILRELEGYDFSPDVKIWAQERGLNPESSQVIEYHQYLGKIYPEIENVLGKIDSQVSDFDFQMNARAAQKLRRSD